MDTVETLLARPEVSLWVKTTIQAATASWSADNLRPAVIWRNHPIPPDDEPVGGHDPSALLEEINGGGMPLLRDHDPGFPAGRIFAAKLFRTGSTEEFVAAIIGYYDANQKLSFDDFRVPEATNFRELIAREGQGRFGLQIGVDPREVDELWLQQVLQESPVPIQYRQLSHNAAEASAELIRLGIPAFVLLFWNPFVSAFASETAKDAYSGSKRWFKSLLKNLEKRRNPIVALQTSWNKASVMFLFRGKDVDELYRAHEAVAEAMHNACGLVDSFVKSGHPLESVTYEFENSRWVPSHAILEDGRLVTDRNILIAHEQLPKQLSLGLGASIRKR